MFPLVRSPRCTLRYPNWTRPQQTKLRLTMATAKKTTRRTSSSAASRTKTTVKDRTKAYAQAVIKGKVVAGPHVRNACRRHLDDLKNGKKRGLTFDLEAADRLFRFFENVLRLSEGQ